MVPQFTLRPVYYESPGNALMDNGRRYQRRECSRILQSRAPRWHLGQPLGCELILRGGRIDEPLIVPRHLYVTQRLARQPRLPAYW